MLNTRVRRFNDYWYHYGTMNQPRIDYVENRVRNIIVIIDPGFIAASDKAVETISIVNSVTY